MAAGKSEGTMKIERVGRTWVGDLLDRLGVLLRCIAPGFVGLYVWSVVIEEGGYNLTWLTAVSAAALGFLIYALHTCFLSRLVLRPATLLSILSNENHPWISSDQRKLAERGSKMLLLELASQRWRRRISESAEVKAVQKGLDRRCTLGGFLYCSSYAILLVGALALCPRVAELGDTRLVSHALIFGCVLLVVSIISGYFTMQTDLWAAATYPQGKTTKVKAVTARASQAKSVKRASSTAKTAKATNKSKATKTTKARKKTR